MKIRFADRKSLTRILVILVAITVILAVCTFYMITMPGKSYSGVLPELSGPEKEISSALRSHVEYLAMKIGERNFLHPDGLRSSADYI